MIKKYLIIFLTLIITSSAYSKPLPPGTGNTVKANIMFLVDKSHSMNNPANGQTSKGRIMPLNDVVPRGDGSYFTVSVDDGGLAHWDPYNDLLKQDPDVFNGIKNVRIYGTPYSDLMSPLNMEYRDNFLYLLLDKPQPSAGYVLMSIDTREDPTLRNKKYSRNSTRVYKAMGVSQTGTHGYNPNKAMKDTSGQTPRYFTSKPSMDLYGDRIWAISKDAWHVITIKNGHFDQTNQNKVVCGNTNGTLRGLFDGAIDVVEEYGKLFIYSKDDLTSKILKQEINQYTGCPTGSLYQAWDNAGNIDSACGQGRGQSIAVKNQIIYTTGFKTAKVCKYSQNGNTISLVKSVGSKDAYTPNSTTSAEIYFDTPMGITIGAGNSTEESRIYVANQSRNEVVILDQANLDYVDHFGDSGVSLWKGAKDSISNVLIDSSLNQSVNFGIGFWNQRQKNNASNFLGFLGAGGAVDDVNPIFNKPKINTNIANGGAYIGVGINPKGSQQILELFSENKVRLSYETSGLGLTRLMNEYWGRSYGVAGHNVNPIIEGLNCQINAQIIIGDGEFLHAQTKPKQGAANILQTKGVLTFTVGYGEEVVNSAKAMKYFTDIATAGGTHKVVNGVVTEQGVYVAKTPDDLKAVIQKIVQTIVAKSYSFSSPSVSSNIENEGQIFQGKFQNRKNKEWVGNVIKTVLTDDGQATSAKQTWNFSDLIKAPNQRNLWTALEGSAVKNNFNISNVNSIKEYYSVTGNILDDYHRKTVGSNNLTYLTRCKNMPGVVDGVSLDEENGLIQFVRGEDYFDYDGDCDLNEPRSEIDDNGNIKKAYVADFYNSELTVVGAPSANIDTEKQNTESYFRQKKNYSTFAKNNSNRKKIVYGAANNGILHAINADTGEEIWGFIPPLVIPKLPKVIAPSNNQPLGGGSTPLFLLDGSPAIHDTYFNHPILKKEDWYTLLMIPYGRGGAGFSTIDVTDPNNPLHLYSILNDPISEKILRVDHSGKLYQYGYSTTQLNIKDLKEAIEAEENIGSSSICNGTGNTSCYRSKIWTLPGNLDTSGNYKIIVNGLDVTQSTSITNINSVYKINFSKTYQFDATGNTNSDSINIVQVGSLDSAGLEYDYRFLGETWGSPRIFRMPNNGAGDTNVLDDEYVAVLTGGYGNNFPLIGSNVYVIDWLTGKVKKEIKIEDKSYDNNSKNDIVNSIPSSPIVVTADASLSIYSGALVYVNDLEGKITKINLTNMKETPEYDPTTNTLSISTKSISLYDNYILFDVMASSEINNRYMYHSMDVGIGNQSRKLWLFGGTGDFMNLNDTQVDTTKVNNVIFGVKDYTYPSFGTAKSKQQPDNFLRCKNTTNDTTGALCPENGDRGWFIELSKQKKVVNEPTLKNNVVYYPLYEPAKIGSSNSNNSCGGGKAFVCSVDADCGSNITSKLGSINTGDQCLYVGTGVLSKLVAFGLNLYANISGESINKNKPDMVVLDAITESVKNYRSSWRENF
ncbi:PilC/PilY family type IV pilus protein [Candidatus Pelagibacter sp.]|nr:PilC/PilY family type IV pilus protein [Candidatus Pelagibacter sp.]